MALLKLSGLVSKISGKLGGVVFGSGSNGNYVKSNSYSQQPNTPAQSIQRNKIIQASQTWRNTTPTQKTNWASQVVNYPYTNRLGDIAYYTAFQLFQFLNQNNFQNGYPILLSPPVYVPVINASWVVSVNPSSQLIMATTNGVAGTTAIVYCSPPLYPGVTPAPSLFRKVVSIPLVGGSQSLGIESAYREVFNPQSGSFVVWAKVKTIVQNNGNTTVFQEPTYTTFVFS